MKAKKNWRVSIAQNNVESYRAMTGNEVQVRLSDSSGNTFPAVLERVEPRASITVLKS